MFVVIVCIEYLEEIDERLEGRTWWWWWWGWGWGGRGACKAVKSERCQRSVQGEKGALLRIFRLVSFTSSWNMNGFFLNGNGSDCFFFRGIRASPSENWLLISRKWLPRFVSGDARHLNSLVSVTATYALRVITGSDAAAAHICAFPGDPGGNSVSVLRVLVFFWRRDDWLEPIGAFERGGGAQTTKIVREHETSQRIIVYRWFLSKVSRKER